MSSRINGPAKKISTDRRKWMLPTIALVLGLAIGSIIWQLSGDGPIRDASPRESYAASLQKELRSDPRFGFLEAMPSPSDDQAILIAGEVMNKDDMPALDELLSKHSKFKFEMQVHPPQ
jgi:hypothetical protein